MFNCQILILLLNIPAHNLIVGVDAMEHARLHSHLLTPVVVVLILVLVVYVDQDARDYDDTTEAT